MEGNIIINSDIGAEYTISEENYLLDAKDSSKAPDVKRDYSNQKISLVPSSMPNQNVVTEPTNQSGILGEDELAGLLLASVGWDDCQLELLDSLLDSL